MRTMNRAPWIAVSSTKTCISAVVLLFATLMVAFSASAQNTRYKLIDVGTFGGPNAVVNGPGVQDLSRSGTYNGLAETAIPDPNCVFPPDCLLFHAQEWRNGVVTDLGTLPGVSNNSGAGGISANGQFIVGGSGNGLIDPVLGFPEMRAVVWTSDGDINDLGTLPGGTESGATSVNSRGQVVGFSNNATPDPFSPFGTQARTFLWQNGVMQDIGTLGGPDALGGAGSTLINERGQITGASFINATPNADNGPDCPPGVPTQDPFLWENGTMTDIGSLGGTCGYVSRLNNRGQVVGNSWLAGNQVVRPFLWDSGVLTDLGTLGGPNGGASDLSDSGLVVGNADRADGTHHAFVWKNGVMKDVGVVPGDLCTNGLAINSRGQAIGTSTDCMDHVEHMFLWENGEIHDLSAMILPGSNIDVVEAFDMNDRGEIAAVGMLSNGDQHAVLLIPASGQEIAAADNSGLSQPTHTAMHRLVKDADSSVPRRRNGALSMFRQTRLP